MLGEHSERLVSAVGHRGHPFGRRPQAGGGAAMTTSEFAVGSPAGRCWTVWVTAGVLLRVVRVKGVEPGGLT